MSSKEKKSFEHYISEIDRSLNYLAKRLSIATRMPFEDAKQEMIIEAWKSYDTYNPDAAKFSTYAVWRLKNRSKTLMTEDIKSEDAMRSRRLEDAQPSSNGEDFDPLDNITSEAGYRVRPCPEEELQAREERAYIQLYGVDPEGKSKLDAAEAYLREQAAIEKEHSKTATINQNALVIFLKLRYEVKKVGLNEVAPKSLTDIANEMRMVVQRVSAIYNQKIKILGKVVGDTSIVEHKARQEVTDMAKDTKKAAAKKAAPAAKGKKAVKEEPKAKGRTAQSGGLKDKIDWVDKTFCKKGKTRAQAIEGLIEKYPDMSLNYAKTLVYTNMKSENGFDWAPSERGGKSEKKTPAKATKKAPASKAKAPAKKATPKKTSKKAADEEEVEEEDEEQDAEDQDDGDDGDEEEDDEF